MVTTEGLMQYVRTFRFSAAHFNSIATYLKVWENQSIPRSEMHEVLRDIHGHNFKAVVVIGGNLDKGDWFADDAEISEIIMEWDAENLSMHDDFFNRRQRATTERMAATLFLKLLNKFGPCIKGVTIYETDDIFAKVGE